MENHRYEEKGTQVLGMSVDNVATQRAFATGLGNIPYPLLSDFHPQGQVSELFGIYNDERGTTKRAVIRFKKIFTEGLPDPKEVLEELDKL